MKDGEGKVTIRDVARRAGVSIATVSRHMNRSGYVDPQTAAAVDAAVRETGYAPSMAAQGMRSGRTRMLLLVVPDIENPFYALIAREAQRLAKERGYALVLYDSREGREELPAVRLAQQMYASGILLGSIDVSPQVTEALAQSGIPLVGLNAYARCPFDTVHVQGSRGTYLAASHLLALGHREIAFAGGAPGSTIERSRLDGYRLALREAGIPPRARDVLEAGFSQEAGYQAGVYFSRLSPMPTAICCANDQIALGVLRALREAGVPVPERVSVTGMDDIPYARVSGPALTTVTNDGAAFAQKGMRLLFERIEGGYAGEPREESVSHELVVRASTAAPEGELKRRRPYVHTV